MPYELFYTRFPELAEKETRCLNLPADNKYGLPPCQYAFMEMFCNEPDCDCSRVFFSVAMDESPEIAATIFWGWKSKEFYRKWLGTSEINIEEELIGPGLDLFNTQSVFSEKILQAFMDLPFKDQSYLSRVKKHYDLFRKSV